MLFKKDIENFAIIEPVPPTITAKMSANGYNFSCMIYFRSGGIASLRPTTMTTFLVNDITV
jgi:hypothetical protein